MPPRTPRPPRLESNCKPMCGIAGIFERAADRPVEVEALARMGGVLAHRGPDGEGTWTGAGVDEPSGEFAGR
jgi:asparagine synthetase B (glutamine-hydrolysing)